MRGLDDVSWAELWVDFGLDPRVLPSLLQQTATGSPAAAREALTAIRRTVFVNREWSEAAPLAIPFLGQALEQRGDTAIRRLIVELLHDLGQGQVRALFPERISPDGASDPEGPEEDAENSPAQPTAANRARWRLECHVSVELLVPALLPLLEEVDDGLVSSVIALLAAFPRAAPLSTPALWKLAREEDDSSLGGQALVALAQLGAPGVADAARVATDASLGSPLAFWAAVADVLASPTPNPVAIQQLVALPEEWGRQSCPFTGRLSKLQRRVLARLPRASVGHAIRALSAHPRLVAQLAGARILVRWAAASAGEDRQRALVLLAEHGPWASATFVNLLEEFEFPASPHELSAASRG